MSEELTFETAMKRLEAVVAQLESGQCTLEDSLKLFREGTELTAFCEKSLKEAEQVVNQLTGEDTEA